MSSRLVMLLGATARSGTNYLHELMRRHPVCHALEPEIPEDYLLAHADLLDDYAWLCGGRWNQIWKGQVQVETVEKARAEILRGLGRGLEEMLLQRVEDAGKQVLVKTPSSGHLPMLREMFGGIRVVLLYRDGRDVAESLHKSFHLKYERCFQQWNRQAGILRKFLREDAGPHHAVSYEALVADPRGVMEGLLAFLGWDAAGYPWERVEDVDILGSSEDYARGWVRTEKRPLQSIGRWKSWPGKRVRRFGWVCGGEMKALGYDGGEEPPRGPARWALRGGDLPFIASEWLGGWVDRAARWWCFIRFGRKWSMPVLGMRGARQRRAPSGQVLYR